MKLGDLSVEVAGHDALAQGLEAAHLRFDRTSSVLAGPALPDGSAQAAATAQGLVARRRLGGRCLPRLAVPAGQDDRRGRLWCNGDVAGTGVMGTVSGATADGPVVRDPVQEVRQQGSVTDPAAGDLDGPDVQRFGIDPEVDLAPVTRLGRAVFPGQPLAIAFAPVVSITRCKAPVLGKGI